VESSVVFDALYGHADAVLAKASNVTKLKTNVRTMDPALRLICLGCSLTAPARPEKRYFDGKPGESPGFRLLHPESRSTGARNH
jgi:hypothetical protein